MGNPLDQRPLSTRLFEQAWQTGNWLSNLLLPVSWIYRVLVALRARAYSIGLLSSKSARVPIVIVGNISVGGSGKTPVVIWLARWLQAQGRKPGIVLRGYGGRSDQWPLRVTTESDSDQCGDEAVLLATELELPVVAGPQRVAACSHLVDEDHVDVIISDDGLQHLALRRNFEILLWNHQSMGNLRCLPAGPLREPVARAGQVDLCVFYNDTTKTHYVKPGLGRAVNLVSGEVVDLDELADLSATNNLVAVTAIAHPQRFFNMLSDLGLEFEQVVFEDHHRFVSRDFGELQQDLILVTGKDAVKCRKFADPRIWRTELTIEPSEQLVQSLTDKLLPAISYE